MKVILSQNELWDILEAKFGKASFILSFGWAKPSGEAKIPPQKISATVYGDTQHGVTQIEHYGDSK